MPYHGRGGAGNISAIQATSERTTTKIQTIQSSEDTRATAKNGHPKSHTNKLANISAALSNLFSKIQKVCNLFLPPLTQHTDTAHQPIHIDVRPREDDRNDFRSQAARQLALVAQSLDYAGEQRAAEEIRKTGRKWYGERVFDQAIRDRLQPEQQGGKGLLKMRSRQVVA